MTGKGMEQDVSCDKEKTTAENEVLEQETEQPEIADETAVEEPAEEKETNKVEDVKEEVKPVIEEKVETTEQVEETETTEQVAIVEQTTATCKINNESACYIYNSAIEYGFDHNQALLVVAISRHETANWTSSLYVNSNNFGGLYNSSAKKFFSYETKEDGLNAMLRTLSKGYFEKGLTTIEDIGAKYCPVGANDNGSNKYWVGSVTEIYNQYQALYN